MAREKAIKPRQMTLANKITVLRILAIPLLVIALIENSLPWARWIFIFSIFSDALDGALARLRRERSTLGSFLDPLADKLLLLATFMTFTYLGWVPVWVFVAIVSRDLLIILGWSVVYILTGNSKIEPRPLGKITTVAQMMVALAKLLDIGAPLYPFLLHGMIAFTILSAFDYVWIGNKRLGPLS
jgi:cardiolipin synthase